MADLVSDDSPLVKLAVAILDDPHGISTVAWERLMETFDAVWSRPPPLIQKLILAIEGGEDRVWLKEGWNG